MILPFVQNLRLPLTTKLIQVLYKDLRQYPFYYVCLQIDRLDFNLISKNKSIYGNKPVILKSVVHYIFAVFKKKLIFLEHIGLFKNAKTKKYSP